MSQRYRHLDMAKGFVMICITLGHLENDLLKRLTYPFTAPVLFLLTGFFITQKQPVREFIIKRAKRLLIPYAVAALLVVLLAAFISGMQGGAQAAILSAREWTYAALYGVGGTYETPFFIKGIGALWWFWGSFWASCMLRLLLELKKGTRLLLVCVIFFASHWSVRLLCLPLSIQAGGVALFFLYVGYLARIALPYIKEIAWELKAAWIVFALISWVMFTIRFTSFWLVICDIGNGIPDLSGALCASCCVLLLMYYVSKGAGRAGDFLAFLGANSIYMYCAHAIELTLFPWESFFARLRLPESGFLFYSIVCKLSFAIVITVICAYVQQRRKNRGAALS